MVQDFVTTVLSTKKCDDGTKRVKHCRKLHDVIYGRLVMKYCRFQHKSLCNLDVEVFNDIETSRKVTFRSTSTEMIR